LLIYTTTFWTTQDIWRLHGVMKIAQALLMPPPPRQAVR
jgi:hypothetical protein